MRSSSRRSASGCVRDVILARHHHFLFIRFARATLSTPPRRSSFFIALSSSGELSAALLRVSDVLHERVHAFDVFLEHLRVQPRASPTPPPPPPRRRT